MGTPAFAVASLDALVEAGVAVAAVVTAPDKPAGRGLQLRASAVKDRAVQLGLPVLQPADLRDPTFLAALDEAEAELFVVVAFRKLPEAVYRRPRLGCINLHASLLPDYRGAAPINWAVINGEPRTGVTTFFITEKIDTGDMIHQEELPIAPDETAGEVHDRLMVLGAGTLVRTVKAIFGGTAPRRPQPSLGSPKAAPKLTPANTRINVVAPALQVHDLVRGLSPFPGAWGSLLLGGKPLRVKLLRTRSVNATSTGKAGALTIDGGKLLLQCTPGTVELLELQPEGRRRMQAAEFLRGLQQRNDLTLS